MDVVWALIGVVAVIHAAYALWIALRLDRLHQRVEAAAAALDDQLHLRAEAAGVAAAGGRTRPVLELARAAAAALAAEGLGQDREQIESGLTRAIAGAINGVPGGTAGGVVGAVVADPTLTAVVARASYARALFNDTVRDALVVRRRRIVRVFRLAGSARMPAFFEMDEAVGVRRTIDG